MSQDRRLAQGAQSIRPPAAGDVALAGGLLWLDVPSISQRREDQLA
eukprot:COSAG06_NODE_4821_length_3928_cov_2.314883_4_plen_46_part_00